MRAPRRAIAVAVAAALLAGACGREPDVAADPKGALQAAIEATGEWDGTTVTLRLDVDEADLPLLAEAMEAEEAAQYLATSTVTFSAHPGADPADAGDDVMSVAVVLAGIDALDLRAIRGDLYLRSDVRALMTEFAPDVDVDAELAELTVAAEAYGVDFLDEVVDGAWLRLTGAKQMAAMLEGMGAAPVPPGLEPSELASEVGTATRQLLEQVAIAHIGSDAAGEHVQVTTTGAELVDTFAPLLEASFGGMWTQFGGGAPLLDDLRSDPGFRRFAATTIPVEVWLADGQLSQVGFDLIQLVRLNPELVETEEDAEVAAEVDRFVLAAGLAPFGGEVETPADAIEVDLFKLAGRAMGMLGGMGGDGMGGMGGTLEQEPTDA